MASIQITRKSGETHTVLVDDADLEAVLAAGPWVVHVKPGYTVYVLRGVSGGTEYLHRFLLSAPKGSVVDHHNHNGLDNRRENLRLCSQSQNLGNTRKAKNNTTGLKGVGFHKASGKYRASIVQNKKHIHLGLFATAEEAHAAYVRAAEKIFGEFASP
jgi:hypothetical protein